MIIKKHLSRKPVSKNNSRQQTLFPSMKITKDSMDNSSIEKSLSEKSRIGSTFDKDEMSRGLIVGKRERLGRSVDTDLSLSSPTTSFSYSLSKDGDISIDESVSLGPIPSKAQFTALLDKSSFESSSTRTTRRNYRKTRVAATGPIHSNTLKLHIYDLISNDTLMELPWGCVFEIGKCFSGVNAALHELGTGAYHVGVEINGIEYAFGSTDIPGRTGIFTCKPKRSLGYQYRSTIDFGQRAVTRRKWKRVPRPDNSGEDRIKVEKHIDGRQIIKEMIPQYMGVDYDLLRKNCCTFARDVCLRMNVPEEEIPSWFRNLAESGAITQDIAYATVQPLQIVMSHCEDDQSTFDQESCGIETIRRTSGRGNQRAIMLAT